MIKAHVYQSSLRSPTQLGLPATNSLPAHGKNDRFKEKNHGGVFEGWKDELGG